MKTPREILLARHKDVEPKLDDIRQSAVAAIHNRRPSPSPADVVTILKTLWSELILPSRRIWAGLAAVWILILAANFSMRDHSSMNTTKSPAASEIAQSFKQQEQLLTELIGPIDLSAAEPQKSYIPRPSSERLLEILAA